MGVGGWGGLMENIPAQSETSHDVSHTCSKMSVIWIKRQRTSAQRLSIHYLMSTTASVIHSGCLKNVSMLFCIWVTAWEQNKNKNQASLNTLEIDSSKNTGHSQDSRYYLKHGKLWSALLIQLNARIFVCTLVASAAAAVRPEGRGQTRLRRWTQIVHRFRLGSDRKQKEKHSVCVTTFITSFISMFLRPCQVKWMWNVHQLNVKIVTQMQKQFYY